MNVIEKLEIITVLTDCSLYEAKTVLCFGLVTASEIELVYRTPKVLCITALADASYKFLMYYLISILLKRILQLLVSFVIVLKPNKEALDHVCWGGG